MEMGKNEIAVQYKGARKKAEMIKILADLNACSEEEIREVLVEQKLLPKPKRKYTRRAKKLEPVKAIPDPSFSEGFTERIFKMLDGIETDIKALTFEVDYHQKKIDESNERIKSLEKTYKEAADFIKRIGIKREKNIEEDN